MVTSDGVGALSQTSPRDAHRNTGCVHPERQTRRVHATLLYVRCRGPLRVTPYATSDSWPKVTVDAIRGEKTLAELAKLFDVYPNHGLEEPVARAGGRRVRRRGVE